VNGAKFLEGCLTAAKKNGAIVIENAGEIQFVLANGKIAAVKISCGTFSAPHFIASAGAWTDQLLSPLGLRYGIEPIRGQLVVYDVPSATFPFPVYTKKDGYITPKRDGTTLAGTTVEEAGFENVTTEAGRKKIVSHAESLVRSIISFPVRHMTTGLRPRPSGDLPLIGPSKTFPNLIVAAGHYRNGVLLAPVTAKIVSALVANQKPPVDLAPFLPNA
jgi:glycine oxidase